MQKRIFLFVIFPLLFVFCRVAYSAEAQQPINPVAKFLKSIEYTSRIKLEYDDNIFSTENNQDSDFRPIFTQAMTYKHPQGNHYLQLGYSGNYSYYEEESVNLLGHAANFLYSYRPFNNFSVGFRDDYNWLSDSKIASTLGDRVLALGYAQDVPSFEMKYEFNPRGTFITDAYFQTLDVRNRDNDDFIDNKRVGVKGQIQYNMTENRDYVGFFGFEQRKINFTQTDEKTATSQRAFVGLSQKAFDFVSLTHEVGFEQIDMQNDVNIDDSNVDYKFSLETIYSLYTKLKLSFGYNAKNPSLRREYTQYSSNLAAASFSHAFDPKTILFLDYSYEKQNFNSSDALSGQLKENKDTFIQNVELTLSRKLKPWLTVDCKYDYTKRDTDFAQEGYTDNKISTALTAKY